MSNCVCAAVAAEVSFEVPAEGRTGRLCQQLVQHRSTINRGLQCTVQGVHTKSTHTRMSTRPSGTHTITMTTTENDCSAGMLGADVTSASAFGSESEGVISASGDW